MDRAFRRYFSQADLDRITSAVKEAEAKTSGEIIPYFVLRSDSYHETAWRAGALGGATILLIALVVILFLDVWMPVSLPEVCIIALGVGALAFLLTHLVPTFQRMLAGKETMAHRVHQRAQQAFLSEEVFKTRERTGILLFLSLFERRVVVMGDAGINANVEQSHWDGIVRMVVEGMKRGQPADGLVTAIDRCGELLAKHGVKRRRDDTDELSDNLRMSKQ